jgi:hypothetical protein
MQLTLTVTPSSETVYIYISYAAVGVVWSMSKYNTKLFLKKSQLEVHSVIMNWMKITVTEIT